MGAKAGEPFGLGPNAPATVLRSLLGGPLSGVARLVSAAFGSYGTNGTTVNTL